MRLRIALGCGQPGVSYAILGDGNDAATRLTRPGDAVFSDRGGAAGPSPIIRIAELPNRERLAWLATIGDLGKGASYPPPAVFDPAAPARIEPRCTTLMAQQGWSAPGATVDAWLGEPIAMASGTSATFERDPYSNLLIVADQDLGYRLLTAAVLSIATRLAPADASFAVADFARSSSPFRGHFGRVAEQVPHTVDVAGPRGAAQMVDGLIELLDTRAAAPLSPHPSRFLIVAGLHRWDELAGEYRQRSDVADRLARLADEGPELGIHLVVWSEGYAAVERAWQRDGLRLFYLRVAGPGTSESDSTAVLGTPAASTLTENRALFTTKDWPPGQTEKFKPYALPSIEAFAPLGKRSPASLDVR
jgi:hypothetical protein